VTPDQRERLKLITKLFASFESFGDPEAGIAALLEDTSDIPTPWLTEGVRSFRDDGERQRVPSVGKVRQACAIAVRKAHAKLSGEPYRPPGDANPLDVGKTLRWAASMAPQGYAQLGAVVASRDPGSRRTSALSASERPREIGPRSGAKTAGVAAGRVMGGLTVVDRDGAPLPVPKVAQEISEAGRHVPGWHHSSKSMAVRGRTLATILAYERLLPNEPNPIAIALDEDDWSSLDIAMRHHSKEDGIGAEEIAWWIEVVKRYRKPAQGGERRSQWWED
jgi:hypothetical protein